MRKNWYYSQLFGRKNVRKRVPMSWDVKLQIAIVAAFLIATAIAYIAINAVYA